MRFEFIRVEKTHYPLTVLCRVLLVSTSGFYAWCHREPSDGELRRRALAAKIEASHQASHETYGSPRVTRELRTNGEPVSRKTVAKIMRQEGIVARKKRRFKEFRGGARMCSFGRCISSSYEFGAGGRHVVSVTPAEAAV